MAADPLCLALTTFPQHWDGKGKLTLNVVLVPAVDPTPIPLIGSSPSFANGAPTFRVMINKGLGVLPSSTDPNALTLTPTIISPAAAKATTFAMLQSQVTASGATLAKVTDVTVSGIRKPLPPSYMAAGGAPPDGELTTTEDEFGCAVRGNPPVRVPKTPPPRTVSWGQVISYALRQPVLAIKLGLLYQLSVTLPQTSADALAAGGYIFVTLVPSDPWAVAAAATPAIRTIRTYAARIPPLTASPRALFAPVEFPVDWIGPPLDGAFAIADTYADGFAKLVHVAQPTNAAAAVGDGELAPGSDLGIEIGWDDQQVTQWHQDQLDLLAATKKPGGLDSTSKVPIGVQGYRVDVADVTHAAPGSPPVWQSLCRVTTTLPSQLGTYTGELCIEPVPALPNSGMAALAWLPRYFATWRGGSLCEPDPIPKALTSRKAPDKPTRTAVDLTTLLSYGHVYSFRVRLGDLSNGGPVVADGPVDPGSAGTATQLFQRLVPPKAPVVQQLDANNKVIASNAGVASAPAALLIQRPSIVYPEVLYTHLGDQAGWRDTIRKTLVNGAMAGKSGITGLPDPDVAAVSIEVRVRHPLHDIGTDDGVFVPLYTTTRTLNATTGAKPLSTDPGTRIGIVFVNAPSIVTWSPGGQPTTGPLLIPRGRDVQIVVRALLRTESNYFGPQASQSMATRILLRQEPAGEPLLLGRADAHEPITGYLFRRPAGVSAPPLVAQLAEQLGVLANGNSLATPPGQRTVFGASMALRAHISADGESLTFGATAELLRYWIVAIVLDLERDWTWDGLADTGFTILRGDSSATAPVGAITVPRVLGSNATTHPSAQERARTRLIFLDAIDPHEPVRGGFPQSLQHRWSVKPNRTPAGPPLPPSPPTPVYTTPPPSLTGTEFVEKPLDLRLPIAIPPKQVPAIASVGLALSPYEAGELYASTARRQRALWIELTEPIENAAGDALFCRVLAHGADPLLYGAMPRAVADSNPALPLDPELVRAIIPADTDDRAGLNAMTQLTPASPGSANVHYLLPLPPGMDADDPELFGFWTYELRVGHAGPPRDLTWWSTANARFGSPLRVVGVQHPAPALACHAGRVNIPAASAAGVLNAITAPACPFQVVQVMAPLAEQASPPSGPASMIIATAPYATPVLNGEHLTGTQERPRTSMWFLLYAQAVQADGASMRNILIATEPGVFANRELDLVDPALRPYFNTLATNSLNSFNRVAVAAFHQAQIESMLESVHLPASSELSVLAVELLPAGTGTVGFNVADRPTAAPVARAAAVAPRVPPTFPFGRILRASPLEPVAPFC